MQSSPDLWKVICMSEMNRIVYQPSQRIPLVQHLMLVNVKMQLLKVLVLPLHCPEEWTVFHLHCVEGTHPDLQGIEMHIIHNRNSFSQK